MKKIYIASWILLTLTLVATVLTDGFDSTSLVVFSFAVFAMVYALAVWSVLTNTRKFKSENLRKI